MNQKSPSKDIQYESIEYQLSEIEHAYGPRVHILSNPLLLSQLAILCSEETQQPLINECVEQIYGSMIRIVVNREFETRQTVVRTRMAAAHPNEGLYQGPMVDLAIKAICVNLARAGTLPSYVCYRFLNYLLDPQKVRQDHISIARQTDAAEKVTGSEVSGHKIGGGSEGAYVLFPDPMGATGGTIVQAVKMFRELGKAKKLIAIHCIVTPEYLKTVLDADPDLIVYAIRLDRGLSEAEILSSIPGTNWQKERGLNEKDYIVPGGGGFGEILNNAYV